MFVTERVGPNDTNIYIRVYDEEMEMDNKEEEEEEEEFKLGDESENKEENEEEEAEEMGEEEESLRPPSPHQLMHVNQPGQLS
eukprot:13911402-Ditylum_brightwellii.AAC.1